MALLAVVAFFTTYLAYIYVQSFNKVKDQELNAVSYNPPEMILAGDIIKVLEGGRGYAIRSATPTGNIEAVAFYPDGRLVDMDGRVKVRGKFIGNNCNYKAVFGGKCVPYMEIVSIENVK